MDKENFIADIININWDQILELDKGDPNHSFISFENKINQTLDNYAPLKKLSKKEYKQLSKPWITTGIRRSISRRDILFNKFIKCNDIEKKKELHLDF